MRIRVIFIIFCLSQTSHSAEETLGRLFHTPEQRARLNVLRQQSSAVDHSEKPIFSFDGEVRRSSGHDTHWINGESRNGQPKPSEKIPVGDRIDPQNGEQYRLLGDGQLHIKRPPP